MLSLTRKDYIGAFATGVTAGTIGWQLAKRLLDTEQWLNIPLIFLPLLVPVLWILGIELGHRLGRRWHFFTQFGRFVAIGLTNATVDFGLFNLLFTLTGRQPSLFLWMNIASFVAAVTHSYLWNKFWTFDAHGSHDQTREFLAFIIVNIVALSVNTAVAYITFHELVALAGMGVIGAANIGKAAGALIGLIFNFLGFRFVVFKKRHDPFDDPYVV